MKGKQAILRYLETHRYFTAKDVATECGMTINCITKNAIDLERARNIVRVSKVWRTVTYRLATPEEQDGTARNCTNGIFQECRNSAAMKRVLMVWGEGRGMSEWSDYRWIVRTMAKGNGVTLISIARHCGVSNRKLNQILQAGPSKEQEELIAEALGCAGCDLAEIHRQMGELSDKYGRAGV